MKIRNERNKELCSLVQGIGREAVFWAVQVGKGPYGITAHCIVDLILLN